MLSHCFQDFLENISVNMWPSWFKVANGLTIIWNFCIFSHFSLILSFFSILLLFGPADGISESNEKQKTKDEIVRRPFPPEKLDSMEENVVTYFDVREIHPFVVNVDRDNSQVSFYLSLILSI